jgi:hypothetical protein
MGRVYKKEEIGREMNLAESTLCYNVGCISLKEEIR